MSRESADDTSATPFDRHVQTIRELWESFNRGDYETTLSLAHPEAELQDHPDMPDAGWHNGREGAASWAVKLWESFGEIQIEPYEFIPITDDMLVVAVTVSATGKRGGVPGQRDVVALVGMRDGLCARMALYDAKSEALRGAAEALETLGLSE
jgi:ketosteroid isomerase-like protein